MQFKEADMYPPVKKFLEAAGYTVTAEVKGADVTAVKSDELIILELKRQFNAKLLFQALERQKITGGVYVCLPRPKRANSAQFKNIRHIIKCLKLGLITVAMDSSIKTVEVLIEPEYDEEKKQGKAAGQKKRALLLEIAGRSADINSGGSNNKKLLTAYREKCIKISCALYENGPMRASELVKKFGCDKNAYDIMYSNFYGWFKREDGVFNLTAAGAAVVEGAEFAEIVENYRLKNE